MVISGKTRVCAVIGDPISHSLSPIIHNAAFEALRLDFAYLAFRVKTADIKNAISGIRALGIHGLNVTMPHKSAILGYMDQTDQIAQMTASVNTVLNKDGRLFGYNTDGVGAIHALKENGIELKGKKVLIVGAGSAARAIAYAFAQEAGEIVILNRTTEAAEDIVKLLEKAFHKTFVADKFSQAALKNSLSDTDILINATSVGMKPNINETPVPSFLLKPHLTLMDIVYDPLETKLVRDAKAVGATVVSGVEMLIHQGAASFEIWTGHKAPVEVMRKATINCLQRNQT